MKLLKTDKLENKKLPLNKINTLKITTKEKRLLKEFINSQDSWTTAWHLINFSYSAVKEGTGFLASLAWNNNGPFKGDMAAFIKGGSLNIDDIVNGILEKFEGKNPNFNDMVKGVGIVHRRYNWLQPNGFKWKMGIKAMGGEETLEYILQKASTPWTLKKKQTFIFTKLVLPTNIINQTQKNEIINKIKSLKEGDSIVWGEYSHKLNDDDLKDVSKLLSLINKDSFLIKYKNIFVKIQNMLEKPGLFGNTKLNKEQKDLTKFKNIVGI